MTIHMERPSVPEELTADRQNVRNSGLAVESFKQVADDRSRIDNATVAALRDHGLRSRSGTKAERFERLSVGRDAGRRFDRYTSVAKWGASERHLFSSANFDRMAPDVCIPTSARGSDSVRREAVDFRAPAQRSIERMQTITAAALGVIAGFVLFLFLLYAS